MSRAGRALSSGRHETRLPAPVEVLSELRRWRRDRRARRDHRPSLQSLPRSLERGTAYALVELSRRVGTEDWDTSVRRIVKVDAELLEVDRVSFWSLHEETASIHCDAGYVASMQTFEHGATLSEPQLPEYFAAMREARIIQMDDVRTDPRCHGLRDYCAARGIASMLDVPVWVEGQLSGVVCHEHVGLVRRWRAAEEDFVTCVSQIVSSALAARARSEAEAATQRAAFLDTVSCVLASLDGREVAHRAVSLCVPKLADIALVWVENRDGVLECKALKHSDSTKHDLVRAYERRHSAKFQREAPSMAKRVARQGQSLLIPDLNPSVLDRYGFSPKDIDAILRFGLATGICVPLAVGGKPFGAMTFMAGDRRYDLGDLALAESIASRVAAALENARLYEVARDAVRARDELLVLAAHELRTPLTALQLTTDHLLRQARRGDDATETARGEKIARHVRRFSALVDHILDALNVRAEGVMLVPGRCDLAEIVRDRIGLFAGRAQAAGSTIVLSSPPSMTGTWDRARLETVVDALLDNAVKFGRGQPIEVTLRVDDGWAELAVRDHGIGFALEGLPAFFDPFERGVTKEHFGGLGLGLYVAKAIVDAHRGSITATSRPDEGATFVVRLPLGA